ncbi:MAG: formylglycine-generating enzyme family protein [Chthoniobacterales bacterium]
MKRFSLAILATATAFSPMVQATPMAEIAGGTYIRPLEKDGKPRPVESFLIDTKPVTNGEFLAFVRENPRWSRSQVNRLFADKNYLRHWQGDLELGPNAPENAPVVNVSWFAARAYLKNVSQRLPTIDEWEYVARADATRADASADPDFKAKILNWYSRPATTPLPPVGASEANVYGVHDLHLLIWEWTDDFNSALGVGESRADGSPNAALFCGGAGLNKNSATEYADFMRFGMRTSLQGNYCIGTLGFRGARDIQKK